MKSVHHARLLRAAVIAILLTLAGGAVAAPAQAAAYRYWGYFHLTKGAWAFAATGPAQIVPADGAVDGWRFAVADESSIRTPRATPTFAALCSSTAAIPWPVRREPTTGPRGAGTGRLWAWATAKA